MSPWQSATLYLFLRVELGRLEGSRISRAAPLGSRGQLYLQMRDPFETDAPIRSPAADSCIYNYGTRLKLTRRSAAAADSCIYKYGCPRIFSPKLKVRAHGLWRSQ